MFVDVEVWQSFVDIEVWQTQVSAPAPSTPQISFKRGVLTGAGEKWKGVALPLILYSDGHFSSRPTSDLIKSSVFHILTTKRGTRLMRPSFGSPFPEMVFEQNDSVLESEIRTYVTESLQEQEPRINIESVGVSRSQSGNEVEVIIDYTIIETGEVVKQKMEFEPNNTESIRMVIDG